MTGKPWELNQPPTQVPYIAENPELKPLKVESWVNYPSMTVSCCTR